MAIGGGGFRYLLCQLLYYVKKISYSRLELKIEFINLLNLKKNA